MQRAVALCAPCVLKPRHISRLNWEGKMTMLRGVRAELRPKFIARAQADARWREVERMASGRAKTGEGVNYDDFNLAANRLFRARAKGETLAKRADVDLIAETVNADDFDPIYA